MIDKRVTLIVGAGITGLTVAVMLAEAGQNCVLAEKDTSVGGMCRTFIIDDVVFDLGPHLFFHNPDAPAEQMLFELMQGEEFIKKKANYSIFTAGKHRRQPTRLWDPLSFSWAEKKDFFRSRFGKGKENKYKQDSLAYSLSNKIGYTHYTLLYEKLLLKKTHVLGSELHKDWLQRADRTVFNKRQPPLNINPIKVLSHLIRIVLNPQYYYPLEGFGLYPRKLWQRYTAAGGKTILDCGSIDLDIRDNKINQVSVGDQKFLTNNVIWTASVNELNSKLKIKEPKAHFVDTLVALLTFKQSSNNNHYNSKPN